MERTHSRVFTDKKLAIIASQTYANNIMEDVYVHESTFGDGALQYTLRTLSEIFSPDSIHVVHYAEFKKRESHE